MISFIKIVVDCGDPSMNITLQNMEYVSGSPPAVTSYLSSQVLKCQAGFRWSDTTTVKNITCQANQFWSPIPACVGTKKIFLHFTCQHCQLIVFS